MIIAHGTNQQIESLKARAGIPAEADVYLVKDHYMESLDTHRALFSWSTATTIQEAEGERLVYEQQLEEELERQREEARLQAEQEAQNEENNEDSEEEEEEESEGE